jgi:hypothetical protein
MFSIKQRMAETFASKGFQVRLAANPLGVRLCEKYTTLFGIT